MVLSDLVEDGFRVGLSVRRQWVVVWCRELGKQFWGGWGLMAKGLD